MLHDIEKLTTYSQLPEIKFPDVTFIHRLKGNYVAISSSAFAVARIPGRKLRQDGRLQYYSLIKKEELHSVIDTIILNYAMSWQCHCVLVELPPDEPFMWEMHSRLGSLGQPVWPRPRKRNSKTK